MQAVAPLVLTMSLMASLTCTPVFAAAKLDTGFLERKQLVPETKPTPVVNPPKNSSKRFAPEDKNQSSLKETAETVNSLTLLLKNTTPTPSLNRNVLLLNRAAAFNLYGRLKILGASGGIDSDSRRYLTAAIRDANEVLRSQFRNQEQTLKAYDVLGVSYLYLDQNAEAQRNFLEVLKLNPLPEKAGWIGLVIAEDFFDRGKYHDASTYYLKYFPKMSPDGKELALYKLAWCMMNLDRPDQAEAYLARVAKSRARSGLGKDAIRDLAFLVTRRKEPMKAVVKAEGYLGDETSRIDFLNYVRLSFEGMGATDLHSQVVDRLMKLEKDSERRFDLVLSNLRVRAKLFATAEHLSAFTKVVTYLEKQDDDEIEQIRKKYDTTLESELQLLIKSYVDTYAGRARTPDKLSKRDLLLGMKTAFRYYDRYFADKKDYKLMVSIWSDVCLDSADWTGIVEVSELVLKKEDALGSFSERAYLDEIGALEHLPGSDNTKLRKRRIKEFVEKYSKSPQWLRVAKLYAQTEIEDKEFDSALPILEKIFEKDPTEDSFLRLQQTRFQLKRYDSIVSETRGKNYLRPGSEVAGVYRETALALAQEAKSDDSAEDYRKYNALFLSLSTDGSKSRIARKNYSDFLIEKDQVGNALKEFLALPPSEAVSPEWNQTREKLWKWAVDRGSFTEAKRLADLSGADGWSARKRITDLFFGLPLDAVGLSAIPPQDRSYFLGLLALTDPKQVVSYFRGKSNLSADEKGFLALAQKISRNRVEKLVSPNTPIAVERAIDQVQFPELAKLGSDAQGEAVQAVLGRVQSLRSQVVGAVRGKSVETQVRVLEKASSLEARVAEFITGSPVPKQLKGEQLAQYRAGLAEVAAEFSNQAREFQTLAYEMKRKGAIETQLERVHSLPIPRPADWSWPGGMESDDQIKFVFKLKNLGNLIGALALLDYHRAKPDGELKDDSDFFGMRAGLLLTSSGTPGQPSALGNYVLEELESNHQEKWIEKWRSL